MNFKKVQKRTARNLFNLGLNIYLLPYKVNPNNVWGLGRIYKISDDRNMNFDDIVNEFEYYNCSYNELGKYAAFYIENK